MSPPCGGSGEVGREGGWEGGREGREGGRDGEGNEWMSKGTIL